MTSGEAATPPLVCTTTALDTLPDLADVCGAHGVAFEGPRFSLAGRGEALRIPLDTSRPVDDVTRQIRDALASISGTSGEDLAPGRGPVAFGALGFSAGEAALVVPSVIVGVDHVMGTAWSTRVGDGNDADNARRPSPAPQPSSFSVNPLLAPSDWCDRVGDVRARIRGGAARKVVLARHLAVTADAPFELTSVLARLRATFPGCMIFSVDAGNGARFVGASPELLVSRLDDVVRSHPLAGTAPRSSDADTDAQLAAALLASSKDAEEHRITIDMVHDTLLPWCSWLDEEAEPSIVPMANVQHLGTMVEGRLSDPAPSVIDLVLALHPTPAVGGAPRDVALEIIAATEGFDRGLYGGPVGWVDTNGNGEWAVGIRSATISGSHAAVCAGVGVVADSDPVAELAETRAKFQAMLSALVRP